MTPRDRARIRKARLRRALLSACAVISGAALALLSLPSPDPDPSARRRELLQAFAEARFFAGRLAGTPFGPARSRPSRDLILRLRSGPRSAAATRGADGPPSPANESDPAAEALLSGCPREAVRRWTRAVAAAPNDPRLWNDLAVAHSVAAQAERNPRSPLFARCPGGSAGGLDELDALEAASRSLALLPSPEARYNRALALEALHLARQAGLAWKEVAATDPDARWAAEASERRRALVAGVPGARGSSALDEATLVGAIRRGDLAAAARLATSSPQRARALAGKELLQDWSRAILAGQSAAAGALLRAAEALARPLAERGDPYAAEAAAALRRAGSAGALLAARALVEYDEAFALYRGFDDERAIVALDSARRALGAAGLPQALEAEIYAASAENNAGRRDRALARLAAAEPRIETRGFPALRALSSWIRAVIVGRDGRPYDQLEEYRRCRALYERLGEVDRMATADSLLAQALWKLGRRRESWSTYLSATAVAPRVRDPYQRRTIWGQLAFLSHANGRLASGLAFEEEMQRAAAAQADPDAVHEALLLRAQLLAGSGRLDEARGDLERVRREALSIADADDRARTEADLDRIAGMLAVEGEGVQAPHLASPRKRGEGLEALGAGRASARAPVLFSQRRESLEATGAERVGAQAPLLISQRGEGLEAPGAGRASARAPVLFSQRGEGLETLGAGRASAQAPLLISQRDLPPASPSPRSRGEARRGASPPATDALAALDRAVAFYGANGQGVLEGTTRAVRARARAAAGDLAGAEADLAALVTRGTRGGAGWLDRASDEDRYTFGREARRAFSEMVRFLAEVAHRPASAFAYAEAARELLAPRASPAAKASSSFSSSSPSGNNSAAAPARLAALRAALPADTVLVEFAVFDDRTFAWWIAPEGAAFFSTRVSREELSRLAERLDPARGLREDAWNETAARLFDLLLRPFYGRVGAERTLVVVPDGPLAQVPWAGLRDRRRARYVIEDRPVLIDPSASFFLRALARSRELSARSGNEVDAEGGLKAPRAVLVGDPAFDSREWPRMKRLEDAAREAREIAALYGTNAVALTERAATWDAFRAAARGADVIQLGMHASLDPVDPFRSFLLFADRGPRGARTLRDLATLDLPRTRVAILAACESAGEVEPGEGVVGLARPFLAAGVPTVVGSLWEVDDRLAHDFTLGLHRAPSGTPVAEAVRRGILETLSARPFSSQPFSFVVLGF